MAPSGNKPTPLQVLIAGGSIGGVATAIALKAQGHHVKVYEQTFMPDTMGAGISIFPNALSALQMLGVNLQHVRATRARKMTKVHIDMAGSHEDETVELDEKQWPFHNTTYQDLFAALWETLHDSATPGPKAEICSSKQVCRVETDVGILHFTDGSQAQGDVVIGADGVHSVCRSFVPSGRTERFRLKRHVFRGTIARETLLSDPRTAKFTSMDGHVHCYTHQEKNLLIYPASDHKTVCIKYLYDDQMAFKNLSKDWRDPSSKTKLMRLAAGFPEECIALFEQIQPRDLQDQPIWDMDPLITFQNQKMALMGDAAHPMPPYCGQRIAMALEDALALGVLLEPDCPVGEIEERLKLYSRTRKVRAGAVQQTMRGLTEINIGEIQNDVDASSFHTYILGHDEREHMKQALANWKKQQSLLHAPTDRGHEVWKPTHHVGAPPVGRTSVPGMGQKKWWSLRMKNPKPWAKVFT